MRIAACMTVAAIMGATPWAYGQSGDPKNSLQQTLNSQFPLTKITADRNDIVTVGAVLVLQKNGLTMYSTASPLPPLNTYKNGKISQSFGRDLGITLLAPGNATAKTYPQRKFVTVIQKDGIVFQLYSNPDNDIRYYGQLKFPFEKGTVPTPDEALTKIADVLAVQPIDSANNSRRPAPAAQGTQPLQTLGPVYVNSQNNDDRLQLNSDGSFSLQEGGQSFSGMYSVAGATLKLQIVQLQKDVDISIQGNQLIVNGNETWIQPSR
jgi:hypothetical protein